ncbi:ABC transporter permease [Bosea vaviloviae]|uniref:ABC transporter permease n=1 Tax=Bosea vaviloviae TaxID=1526658 RepID=A0A1D7U644_9HYPH|nr:ABC transporter permease [Bosea vaviloviae]AOO82858.1 ABC transporter permease [Bosea vaviloviae]
MAATGLQTASRLLLIAGVFALGAWLQSTGLLPSILKHRSDVIYLIRQHLALAAISGAIAIVVGIPLGIVLTRPRFEGFADAVTQIVNLGTTIPTLALLALSMSFLGIGAPPVIFALFVLTLLPIVLNTIAGLRSVPQPLIEAARGMGMTPAQILRRVELPNAVFVILAGIRTALAINIGTVPLAFLIGGGGLGELIFTGIDLMEPSMLLAGAIPTALLAVTVDFLVGQIQFWLVPKGVNPLR